MSEHQTIRVGRSGNVMTVSLNRPERLNAITSQMLDEITQVYEHLASDVRVVVLAGNGRSFCSGADRVNPPGIAPSGADRAAEIFHAGEGYRASRAIAGASAVTVARLHGHVIGGGAVLAVNCDFRIADVTARISFPEVRLGIPLAWGAWPVLVREIGASRARHVVFFGDDVAAEPAMEMGLLHQVVAAGCLGVETKRLVDRLLDLPELSVRMTKRQLLAGSSHAPEELAALDAQLYAEAMSVGWEPFID